MITGKLYYIKRRRKKSMHKQILCAYKIIVRINAPVFYTPPCNLDIYMHKCVNYLNLTFSFKLIPQYILIPW